MNLRSLTSHLATILRADPKAAKEAMEREKKANEEEHKAKGEKKRGRHSDKQDAYAELTDSPALGHPTHKPSSQGSLGIPILVKTFCRYLLPYLILKFAV